MSPEFLILLIAILYLALMIAIGFWANRRIHSAREFLAAGQSLGFFVMAISSFSAIQSGWGMVGSTGATFDWGPQQLVVGVLFGPIGFALAWFLLGTRLRRAAQRHQLYSIPDLVQARYQSKSAHVAMSLAMLLGTISYMTAQVVATGIITSLLLGVPFLTGALIGSLVAAVYTVAGGMLAAVWTDLVQGLMMIGISVVVFIVALTSGGGWSNILGTLAAEDSGLVSLSGANTVTWVLANSLMAILGVIAQPQLVHKFLMLKDPRELRWGATIAALGYWTTTLFILGVGLAMRSAVLEGRTEPPATIDDAATDFLANMTHPVLAGLALTTLLAAIMSSTNSFITIGASAIMRDLAGALGLRVRRELLWSRVSAIFIVLASLGIALYLDQIIYLLGAIGWAAFAGAIFGPIIIGAYWGRATGAAATAAIVVGLVLNFVLTVLTAQEIVQPPGFFFTGGVTVAVSILVFVGVSLLRRSPADEARFASFYPEMVARQPDARTGAPWTGGQRRIDRLVLGFAALLLVALVGMLADVPQFLSLTLPLMMLVLMLLGSLDWAHRWPRRLLGLVLAFHVVSVVLWLVVTSSLTSQAVVFGGFSLAMGVFLYLAWPFYSFLSGPLYAYALRHIDRREELGQEPPAETHPGEDPLASPR